MAGNKCTGDFMASEQLFTDAYQPREIARRVSTMGVAKAHAPALTLLVLALLAGAFISLGALFYTFVINGSTLGFGVTRLIGGLSFSLGLILVVIGGAELFTGNNLLVVTLGNIVGGTLLVAGIYWLAYLRGEAPEQK